MIEHVLVQLKKSRPILNEAFLRSDNAGCYHMQAPDATRPIDFKENRFHIWGASVETTDAVLNLKGRRHIGIED